jgi:hypothetical protein
VSPGCALFRTKDLMQSLEIDIANPYGLDFNKYGAGNDLLLFLNTAKNYSKIRISTNVTAFFRAHNESFSIANRLNTYYEYAKLHFIEKHYPIFLPKFKAVLWTRRKRKLTDDKIYNLVKGRIAWFYLIKQLMFKLLYRITT